MGVVVFYHRSPGERSSSIAVRPQPREIVPGSLPAADVALVSRWIDLNQDVIADYWDGVIDFDDIEPRLQQLQP